MNTNEIRSSHPSSAQVETLIEFLEGNPGLAKGFLRSQNARERSRRQWEELAVRLNCLNGTTKNYKQWTKYWSDKKSAIKKKAAARSAARRRTGGGVEDVVELSALEERILALCGGESFSTGDVHLGIEPFPDNNTPSPPPQRPQRQAAGTDNVYSTQELNLPRTEEPPANVILGSEQIDSQLQQQVHSVSFARRLFGTSSSSSAGPSQSILQDFQLAQTPPNPHTYHPSLSPPPITLSHTPTPSPSRRGCTRVASPAVRRRTAASSTSRHATPVASPSRRPRTNMVRSNRGVGSVSSRQTSSAVAPPPSQRRTEFSTTTERFLRVEEQQLEIQRSNAQILQSFLAGSAERERLMTEAVTAVGRGLEAVAEAMTRDRV